MHDIQSTTELSPCGHSDQDKRRETNLYFRRPFTIDLVICRTCGLRRWTDSTRERFNDWVTNLRRDRRDVFQLQFYLPEGARHGLGELLVNYPGTRPSAMVRVLTSVYLSTRARRHDFQDILDRVALRPLYQKYTYGRRRKTSVQFSPTALLDIQRWSAELKIAPHRLVENAIFHFVTLNAEADPYLNRYWKIHLLPQVNAILRAI